MILYISGGIIIGLILVLAQRFWIKDKEKWKDLLNNSFLLVATFLGVVLALYFTDLESNSEKRTRAVSVLNLSIQGIGFFEQAINGLTTYPDSNSSLLKL